MKAEERGGLSLMEGGRGDDDTITARGRRGGEQNARRNGERREDGGDANVPKRLSLTLNAVGFGC